LVVDPGFFVFVLVDRPGGEVSRERLFPRAVVVDAELISNRAERRGMVFT
jgi:hypothetical protein